jgi:sigma-B regulation protein RsbU (phosphoserine phosphatase)
MTWIKNLSLKFKLILLLITLTGAMLSIYAFLAVRDFEKDKLAYVLDSSLSHARATSLQINSEVGFVVQRIQYLMRGYNYDRNTFHADSSNAFSGEKNLDLITTYLWDSATSSYQNTSQLFKSEVTDADFNRINNWQDLMSQTLNNDIAIYKSPEEKEWYLGLKFDKPDGSPLIVISRLNTGYFLNNFEVAQMHDTYLIDTNGKTVVEPAMKTYSIPDDTMSKAVADVLAKIKSPEGILKYNSTEDNLLVSMASTGYGQMRVISIVTERVALETINKIILKSALFFVFLIFITIFLSVISSTQMTASLKQLLLATQEIAKGNYSVLVQVRSKDEIGKLSTGFNKMALEIERLMLETAEKARMEGELKTAQLVQSTLFPKSALIDRGLEIRGYYQPASECSGDWWHYSQIGQKTLFCIGDATGHGVPAALLTAAARSAASALEAYPNIPINEMMSVFNRAIFNTANGQVMMTLFLGIYDRESGLITYTNASHEQPYLLPQKENGFTKKDIILLNEVSGPRLGEQLEASYQSAQVAFNDGDRLMLYTDGVTELKNNEKKMWGERQLLRLLVNSVLQKQDVSQTLDLIANQINDFRNNHPLEDDVTYFMVHKSQSNKVA